MTDSAHLPARRPTVVDGEMIAEYHLSTSPMYPLRGTAGLGRRLDGTRKGAWDGRIVTDPAEVEEIRACIAYGKLPWLVRLFTPAPKGWKR